MPASSAYRWILTVAFIVLVVLAAGYYAATPDAPSAGNADEALLRLNTQGISEEPNAILDDLQVTRFDDLDRELPELKALLAP